MHWDDTLTSFIVDCFVIAGSSIIAAGPFADGRHRASWAKFLMALTGSVGILSFGGDMALNLHHFGFTLHAGHVLWRLHLATEGWMVGWLTALLISGELKGRKADISKEPSFKSWFRNSFGWHVGAEEFAEGGDGKGCAGMVVAAICDGVVAMGERTIGDGAL